MCRCMTRVFLLTVLLLHPCRDTGAEVREPGSNGEPAHAGRLDRDGDPLPHGAIARFGTTLFRAGASIQFAELSPDGQFVAAGADRISVFDATTGRIVRHLTESGEQTLVSGVLSPDGKLLATTMRDGTAELREIATGKLVHAFNNRKSDDSLWSYPFFSSDGRVLAQAAFGRRSSVTICVWEAASGKLLAKCKIVPNGQDAIGLSPDGKALVSCGTHVETRTHLFFGGSDAPRREDIVQLWDLQTGKELKRFRVEGAEGLRGAAFAPDGQSIAVAESAGPIVFLDAKDGKVLRQIGRRSRTPRPGNASAEVFRERRAACGRQRSHPSLGRGQRQVLIRPERPSW